MQTMLYNNVCVPYTIPYYYTKADNVFIIFLDLKFNENRMH